MLPEPTQPVQTGPLRYRGIDRHGTAKTGSLKQNDPEQAAKALWILGWRSLTVTRDGIEVAWIQRNPDGNRVWWSES